MDRRIPSPAVLVTAAGALWGAIGYLVLWGHTPLFPSRRMVASGLGLVLFLPVRVVLWVIRAIEGLAGRSFALAESSWWIGLLAAVAGAAIVMLPLLAVRATRRVRPRRVRP